MVIQEIKEHLANLKTINEDELQKAKKRARVNFAQDAEMVSDIADSIGYWTTVCEDVSLADKYLQILDEITCEYLEEIAQKHLNPDNMSISLLLPKKDK